MNSLLLNARRARSLRLAMLMCGALLGGLTGCGREPPQIDGRESAADTEVQADGLELLNAYIRQPAPGQQMLAGFVTFRNSSSDAFTLNHISSPKASVVEVHRTVYDQGKMTMRAVHHVTIPPAADLVFEPGGYHLMLSGVEEQLEPGDQVPLDFMFEGGTVIEVVAEVRPVH